MPQLTLLVCFLEGIEFEFVLLLSIIVKLLFWNDRNRKEVDHKLLMVLLARLCNKEQNECKQHESMYISQPKGFCLSTWLRAQGIVYIFCIVFVLLLMVSFVDSVTKLIVIVNVFLLSYF